MKRKQTLLVAMTALFCAFGAGRLWAASAEENLHLNTNVRIESITKLKPVGTAREEVYFDVVLADASGKWEITGQSFDASSGERPYLILQMPLRGKSVKPAAGAEAETLVETPTAVAYYVGAGASANTMRFVYVVRPGDMSTNITWTAQDTNKVLLGGKIGSVTLKVLDTTTGLDVGGGSVNLTEQVMQCATGVADTAPALPVSGYTITVGDADDNNLGMLYEGLVPVTVTAIASDAGTRSVVTDNALVSRGSFWVEDANGNYYNVGATLMSSDASTIKEANFTTKTATAFDANYAAKVSGLNNANTLSQKFFVNIPAGLAGTAVRLCYGIRPDTTTAKGLYAYAEYIVEETPITNVTKGYAVRNTNMATKQITLPAADELKNGYTALAGQTVTGGEVVVSSGERATFTIAKNGAEEMADAGTLYASIEQISATNAANAKFERYYVPLYTDPATGDYKVALTIGDIGNVDNSSTYYRIRVPALEDANAIGTADKPFYLKVTATPKRERIQLISSEVTTSAGTEYYQPIDTTMGQTPGSYNVLEYTLTVPVSEESRDFLIYPTDATYLHYIDKQATIKGLTDANGNAINAQKLIASYAALQAQGGSVLPNGQAELRVTVPAGETSVKFYVGCVNDYINQVGTSNAEVVLGSGETVRLGGVIFTAKRCNSQNEIIGMLDECSPIVPTVQNRTPMIQAAPSETKTPVGTPLDFTFSVADARTDYLVLEMTYGDGTKDSVLLVDEDAMIAMMGKTAWDAKKIELTNRYGVGSPKALKIEARTTDSQAYTFTHTYTFGTVHSWNLLVTDSSNYSTTREGVVNLETAQIFQFNTIYKPTLPASGYVRWDGNDSGDNWTFSQTYTQTSLSKNGGNTLVSVIAKPFNASDPDAPGGRFVGPDADYDSFFYMWSASSDYEILLPSGAEESRRYEEILSFNRAYVKEGEATEPLAWQDIQLSAIFVAEYLPGDSIVAREKSYNEPYLYELGDYNRDGVPDGWVLNTMGEEARAALIEGASIADKFPGEAEKLPTAGRWGGESAYKFGNSNGVLGSCALDGAAFDYKTRVRGFDEALNAADGKGNWLSVPAWVVLIHPEQKLDDGSTVVRAGTKHVKGKFQQDWTKIKLFSRTKPNDGVKLAYTDNKIPYDANSIGPQVSVNPQDKDWAIVIDEAGAPVKVGDKYKVTNVWVNINRNSPDYEAFRYTYDSALWGYMEKDTVNNRDVETAFRTMSTKPGAVFPFTTIDATAAAVMDPTTRELLPIDQWGYGEYEEVKYFIDSRAIAGVLIDEPFHATKNDKGVIDPRLTSWLERFNGSTADTDRDGIVNSAEYFFWYYASRIAYGSVFTKTNAAGEIEHLQLNSALWPAIDLRNRTAINTDSLYKTAEKFTMGRSFWLNEENKTVYHPIPVETILGVFDPLAQAAGNTDVDDDGLSTAEEFALGTNPIDADTDNDGIPDGWENHFGLNPLNGADANSPDQGNPDGDLCAVVNDVPLYPEYTHLFAVTYKADETHASYDEADYKNNYEPKMTVNNVPVTLKAYYEPETGLVHFFVPHADGLTKAYYRQDEIVASFELKEARKAEYLIDWEWPAQKAIYLQHQSQTVTLSHEEVYYALGFSPNALNTPFTSLMEYEVSVKAAVENAGGMPSMEEIIKFSISPTNADTNEDGIPDGWELYVGMTPYPLDDRHPDGIGDPDGDGLTNAQEYAHRARSGWTNKTAPTDPWNPDTDFDGLWDGDEADPRFIYGNPYIQWETVLPNPIIAGGGCDPNSPDTDGDGMSDAWEVEYGAAPLAMAAPAEGAPEGEDGAPVVQIPTGEYDTETADPDAMTVTLHGYTVTYGSAPDPTRNGVDDNKKRMADYDLDADKDGLTNYQEYLTAALRHVRYDLGPDQARMFADNPGEVASDGEGTWEILPDFYVATTDLLNPYSYVSPEFAGVTVNPISQAIAIASRRTTGNGAMDTRALAKNNQDTAAISETLRTAIASVFNANWTRTMVFPTAQEIEDYGLTNSAKTTTTLEAVKDRVENLPNLIDALDAALRCTLSVTNMGVTDETYARARNRAVAFNGEFGEKNALRVIALLDIVDAELRGLAGESDISGALKTFLQGEALTIWAARKDQILMLLAKSVFDITDSNNAYDTVVEESKNDMTPYTLLEDWSYNNTLDAASGADADKTAEAYKGYEAAVQAATNPLIRSRYRTAMRGLKGGLNAYDIMLTPYKSSLDAFALWTPTKYYFTPIAWHGIVLPFAKREEGVGENPRSVLGVPLEAGMANFGGKYPGYDSNGKPKNSLITTSPLDADTDMDGMDDYFEIFHGLNPVLGDYKNEASGESISADAYINVNRLGSVISVQGSASFFAQMVSPEKTTFNEKALAIADATGFDYYTYPWLAGLPYADPDGDGLLNSEEAVNPVNAGPARYGTDPSPLWMTDPSNPNSLVSRFYPRLNMGYPNTSVPNALQAALSYEGAAGDATPATKSSLFAYEVNEGYDTDGDGISDLVELTSNSIYRGDPQVLRTPDRQQAAYFGGEGALQTMAEAQFGPQALSTFTLECWVRPDADAIANGAKEAILIDRPWRASDEGKMPVGALRHNFVLGLRKEGDAFRPFTYYTSAGTTTVDETTGATTTSAPNVSPEAVAGQLIKADEWAHVAVTYDGQNLKIFLNGVESISVVSPLIPANGVISIKSTSEEVRRYSYRKAPIMVGATAASTWFAELDGSTDDFSDYFMNCFKGFIDEVRIWNGARTSAEIADAYNRTLTQTELLAARLAAFTARHGSTATGYYEANVPCEPLAIYTFNDLLSGSLVRNAEGEPVLDKDGNPTPETKPWEAYPGEKLTGDATVPGSAMYRRKGFRATATDDTAHAWIKDSLPAEEELFTSYYSLKAAKNLRSTKYKDSDTNAEFVPMAHNTVAHLPLADVQRAGVHVYTQESLAEGKPSLEMPSGSAENLKVADSVYWSPYRAGEKVSQTKMYNVKTEGNPYAYMYHGRTFFDLPNYIIVPAFTTSLSSDLLIYGDVFAKYHKETWDKSPATDPESGSQENQEMMTEDANWFRHQDTPNEDTGSKLNDKQFSQGASLLDKFVAMGQTKDSDSDRMPNWWENYYGLDPEDPIGINGPHGDQDGDFLTNYAEYLASANPQKFSTVGNGVSDYQIPIWFRRGAPTFGLLYTDNDFMEDHWEASNRNERLTVDLNDGYRDADDDGWSNFAEARANFRSGYHSTNPNAATSISQTGKIKLEMPTPALRMTVDYFGDQNVYTNATANAKIVVHAYTAKNNNSAPDATFKLPLATTESGEEQATIEHEIGEWKRGIMSGYLHIGNIKPGSLSIKFTRMAVDKADSSTANTSKNENEHLFFTIHSDTKTVGDVAELYYNEPVVWIDEEGNTVANGTDRLIAGTVNYRTGEFTLDFTDAEEWADRGYHEAEDGAISFYERSEFVGVATYSYGVVPGKSNTFTLVKPDEGYIKEGLNNFFIFADLDGDGKWDDNEPAGIPDQHDVDVGFDQVNDVLHVAMTRQAPPGTVRLDVESILGVLMTENETNNEVTGDYSSIMNPSTGNPLNPSLFVSNQNYWICLRVFENIGMTTQAENPGELVYSKQFNVNKPYLSEDEIFGNAETRTGLPRSEAEGQVATSYKVYLLPETKLTTSTSFDWNPYNIAVVTNVFGSLDAASTSLVAPVGGAYLHNADITFEWKSNVQVPAFGLTITKVADAAGTAVNEVVYSDLDIRGVSPSAMANGTGAVEQFIYRYKLPRGVGELDGSMRSLFGDGQYEYTLTLIPYSGSKTVLKGAFNIQLNASGDKELSEMKDAVVDSNFNMQDSYYVRAQVRYNGVLKDSEDFDYRRFVVEAHYSGSFNGDPVASTSDKLGYDDEEGNEAIAALNRCVKMVKDKTEDEGFFSTRFDVELRGLSTNRPVYLMAYFDLNGNGKRDVWEPWGYATQGLDAVGGFYFDPRAITPMSNGTAWNAEFYIQDVDADSDKLADAWEWLTNGQRDTASFFEDGTAGSGWCNTFTGSAANLTSSAAIWTKTVDGKVALTAYGAQLYGLTVEGTPDANGAVKIAGVEDMSAAKELLDLLGNDVAIDLINKGYTSYGLTVNNIAYDGDVITLGWNVESAVGTDGMVYDLTEAFADGNNKLATYTVYGTATLGGAWTKLAEVKVQGALDPAVKIATGDAMINDTEKACFFKVILSAKPMEATIE